MAGSREGILGEGRSETPPGDYLLTGGTLDSYASLTTFNRHVVGTHVTTPHQSIIVELPVFVAVCAVPKTRLRVLPFVLETNGNSVVSERPELLHEPVVQLFAPLAIQKRFYGIASRKKFFPVAPVGILGVREGNNFRVARVPGIFGRLWRMGR